MNQALDIPPEQNLSQLAGLFKACSDPLRLEVLRALKTDSYGVLELCEIFEAKQSGMSHHLKILATHGLVTTRREGNSIFYYRKLVKNQDPLSQSVREFFIQIDRFGLNTKTLEQIAKVKQQRSKLGKAFFSKNVHKFREQQELIAQYEQYFEGSLSLLAKEQRPDHHLALELGSGDGRFLAELSPLFDKVIALDYASEMLSQAKSFSLENGLNNIEFILGELSNAIALDIKVDAIVLNMVLHHLPSPSDCFQELSRLLNEGGQLVITDLCQHEQSWAQEACGDQWLGFKEDDLKNWSTQAGLSFNESRFLGLRNGFQIQFCSFKKNSTKSKAH